MQRFVCTNCGFWQSDFGTPTGCPVCLDFRHTPPDERWEFLDFESASQSATTSWREDEGVWIFGTNPKWGIGPSGYLIPREAGNIFFESCPFYSSAALGFIESQGGIAWLCASHPHAYGGFWQLQDRFSPTIALQVEDLRWTNGFNTNYPFDAQLDLGEGARLIHTGGHFDGHSVLFLERQKTLFAGDLLKFHFDSIGDFEGISTHKGFNRRIPMSHAEIRRYRAVIESLDFERIYTTFERGPNDCRALALRMFDEQLRGAPFFGPMSPDNLSS
jgi:hypothetical protein